MAQNRCKKNFSQIGLRCGALTVCLIYGCILTIMMMTPVASEQFNPYTVLSVSRDASDKDIRKAYKGLAKKWHPDKNKSPKAQEMFVKLTDAYNILSNPERKYRYDTFGTTNDESGIHQEKAFRNGYGFQGFHGFHSFFGGAGNQNIQILTSHIYENDVLPMSYKTPQLIYVYGDWCFQCMQLELIWESSAAALKSLGVGVYELNYQYSRSLNSKLSVNYYPQFIAIADGKTWKYSADEFSEENLRKFVRNILPNRLVKQISTGSYLDFFRSSFIANKPQAILFSNKMGVPLLFLLLAFEYRQKLEFAYVNSESSQTEELRKRYSVHKSEQVFFIMKEEPSHPEIILKDSSLNQKAIREAITSNLFFHLPRLSSQEVFDNICPVSSEHHPIYCVLLFTISSQDHSYHRFVLRKVAKQDYWRQNGVRFLYISEDVQRGFNINAADSVMVCEHEEPALKVLVFVRQTAKKIMYDWLDGGWCVDVPDEATDRLKRFLNMVVDRERLLVQEANISYIYDEHQPHIFLRLANQIGTLVEHFSNSYQFFSWSSPVSLVTNTILLGVIFLVGVLLPIAGRSTSKEDDNVDYTVLGIAKLTAKNYKLLSDKSPPGRFTVVVLLDVKDLSQVESSVIMQSFSDATYSFVRGDMITFAWISIQEQLSWCAEVMDAREFGKVLPGTVLALNGRKKYIHVFKPGGNVNTERLADFIGLESDYEVEDDEYDSQMRRNQKLAARSIRVLLRTWLERLCDGTLTDRIKLDKWPNLEE